MQIKVKALGHRKKPVIQIVSSGAPRQFHEFLLWFKVDGQIIANLIRLYFSLSIDCYFIVVREFPCLSDLESCTGGSNSLPEGSPMPGWSKGRGQTKSSPPCKLGVEGTY